MGTILPLSVLSIQRSSSYERELRSTLFSWNLFVSSKTWDRRQDLKVCSNSICSSLLFEACETPGSVVVVFICGCGDPAGCLCRGWWSSRYASPSTDTDHHLTPNSQETLLLQLNNVRNIRTTLGGSRYISRISVIPILPFLVVKFSS